MRVADPELYGTAMTGSRIMRSEIGQVSNFSVMLSGSKGVGKSNSGSLNLAFFPHARLSFFSISFFFAYQVPFFVVIVQGL